MHLVQFEALSSGPRWGLFKGDYVFALEGAPDLGRLLDQSQQTGATLTQCAEALTTKQRYSMNELLLDGRVRPPLWSEQPEQLQVCRKVGQGWQVLGDGRKLCRPGMPLPLAQPIAPRASLLLAVWRGPTGAALPLGLTLGLLQDDQEAQPWMFGASLALEPIGWGSELVVDYQVARMAAPLHEAELRVRLPEEQQAVALLATLAATPAICVLLDLMEGAGAQPQAAVPSLEHGDGLTLAAQSLGLELRSLAHL